MHEPRVVVAAAIFRNDRLLAARRTRPVELAGLYELPGGKVEDGESDTQALLREIREELGVTIVLLERVGGDWPLGHGLLRVWLARCSTRSEPEALDHGDLRWLSVDQLDDVAWVPDDLEPARAAAAQWARS